jgi:hypothetical protein
MKLLEQVRQALRVKHYAYRTEQCYLRWIGQYIRFHKTDEGFRHPALHHLPFGPSESASCAWPW